MLGHWNIDDDVAPCFDCYICALGDMDCLAAATENKFRLASKEQIIARLKNHKYSDYEQHMINTLKAVYNVDWKGEQIMQDIYAKDIYTLEDFRDDYEHGVIGVYDSFEKARDALINILKDSLSTAIEELERVNEVDCQDDWDREYIKDLYSFIARMNESIEIAKQLTGPYATVNSLYITKHVLQ